MPSLAVTCSCSWITFTPTDSCCGGEWSFLSALDTICNSNWDKVVPLDSGCNLDWDKLVPLDSGCNLDWDKLTDMDVTCSYDWDQSTPLDIQCEKDFEGAIPIDVGCESEWQKATPVDAGCTENWKQLDPVDIPCEYNWDKVAELDVGCEVPWDRATPLDVVCEADMSPKPIVDVNSILCILPWYAARSYIVIDQDVTFIRVSDLQEIKLLNVTIGTDIDSFFWTISGSVASRADLSYIRPINGPVETELVINGYTWRFLIENAGDNYEYHQGGQYSFSGVSPSVELAKPYDTPQTKTYTSLTTAQQIINSEIFADGWNWDWNFNEDAAWQIPADVFSVANASRAEICSMIAKADGGFVNTLGGFPDGTPYEQRLTFNYRYKYSPKDWDTSPMDYTVIDGILKQSLQWEPKPGYDHVYVHGQDQGVNVHVRRTGAPLTNAASSIVDVLTLIQNVGMERGRNFLDQEGTNQTIYNMDLTLPDSAVGTPPVFKPGDLAEFTDLFDTWRGMIRGVQIAVGYPGVTQSIEVERHHVVTGVPETWDHSLTLTLDNTNVDSDLTNFPVLIYLSANCGQNSFDATAFFTELQNDGNRRRIKVEDETTAQCYVEIESYSQVDLECWLWVRVPTLKTASTTELTLYYDRDVSENTTFVGDVGSAAAGAVWDANYLAVYHLKENPTGGASGTIKDSNLARNARPDGTMTIADLVDGNTFKALDFDGSDDVIDCGSDLRPTSITVEAWCFSGNTSNKFLVSNPATVAHSYYDYALRNDQFFFYTSVGPQNVGSRTPTQNVWEYLAGVHTSGTNGFYVDGYPNATGTAAGNLTYETSGQLANTYIAAWQPGSNHEDIIIDEVRISNIARSAAWIKATFYSNTDDLITFT